MGLLIATMTTSRNRMYALMWIAVISLFYYGVKGGLFTIAPAEHIPFKAPRYDYRG